MKNEAIDSAISKVLHTVCVLVLCKMNKLATITTIAYTRVALSQKPPVCPLTSSIAVPFRAKKTNISITNAFPIA